MDRGNIAIAEGGQGDEAEIRKFLLSGFRVEMVRGWQVEGSGQGMVTQLVEDGLGETDQEIDRYRSLNLVYRHPSFTAEDPC